MASSVLRISVLCFATLSVSSSTLFSQTQIGRQQNQLLAAKQAYSKGNFPEAIRLYTAIIGEGVVGDLRANCVNDLADADWAEGRLDLANSLYRQIILEGESKVERPRALWRSAMASMAQGDIQKGTESYEQFAREYPTDDRAPNALLILANTALLIRGDLNTAILRYEDLIQRYPQSPSGQQVMLWLPGIRELSTEEVMSEVSAMRLAVVKAKQRATLQTTRKIAVPAQQNQSH